MILKIKSYFYQIYKIIILLLLTIFGFFITGFLDDYLSIKKKENTGLKTKEKFALQSIVSIIFTFLAYEKNLIDPLFQYLTLGE